MTLERGSSEFPRGKQYGSVTRQNWNELTPLSIPLSLKSAPSQLNGTREEETKQHHSIHASTPASQVGSGTKSRQRARPALPPPGKAPAAAQGGEPLSERGRVLKPPPRSAPAAARTHQRGVAVHRTHGLGAVSSIPNMVATVFLVPAAFMPLAS